LAPWLLGSLAPWLLDFCTTDLRKISTGVSTGCRQKCLDGVGGNVAVFEAEASIPGEDRLALTLTLATSHGT
jgi:hypothetical protein